MGCGSWIKDSIGMFILSYLMLVMMIYSYLPGSGILLFIIICIVLLLLMIAGGWALVIPLSEIYLFIIYPTVKIWLWTGVSLIKLGIFFLSYPFLFLGASGSWLMDVYKGAIGNLIKENTDGKNRPKASYTIVYLFFMFILLSLFGFSPQNLLQLITQATLLAPVIALIPLALTITISGIVKKYSGNSGSSEQQKELQEQQRTVGPDETMDAMEKGKKIGEDAAHTYDNLKEAKDAYDDTKGVYNKIGDKHKRKVGRVAKKGGGRAQKMLGTVVDSARVIPRFGSILTSIAGVGSGVTGALLSGGLLLIALLILFIGSTFILSLFLGAFWSIVVAPFLSEILGGMAGPAAAVAGYANSWAIFGGTIAPDIPAVDLTAEKNALRSATTNIGCYFDPACIAEMQRNQSQRPGAEAQGREFALEVSQFSVGAGRTYNIGSRDKKDGPGVYLVAKNPLKNYWGIPAYDVKYRVRLSHTDGPENCTSEYYPLDQTGRVSDIGERGGVIDAGRTASARKEPDKINLENCGMLQPAGLGPQGGINFRPEVDLEYNYSSLSELNVRLMSSKHLTDRETDIVQDSKQSMTAKTPVQAYINMREPVLFKNDSSGDRKSDIYTLKIGFQASGYKVSGYRVIPEDIRITTSDYLTPVEGEGSANSCKSLEKVSENTYKLSDYGLKNSFNSQKNNDDFWYTKGIKPQLILCDVKIDESIIGTISPTSETARLTIDANYTVRNTQSMTGDESDLKIVNRRCGSTLPCPLLVTKEESKNSKYLNYQCDKSWRFYAAIDGGCTVVENQEDWGNPVRYNKDNPFPSKIETGESAFVMSNVISQIKNNPPKIAAKGRLETKRISHSFDRSAVIGIENSPEEMKENPSIAGITVKDKHAGWILYTEGSTKEVKLERLNKAYCFENKKPDVEQDLATKFGISKDNIIYAEYVEQTPDILSRFDFAIDYFSSGTIWERECTEEIEKEWE
jgi:hypothetical protein